MFYRFSNARPILLIYAKIFITFLNLKMITAKSNRRLILSLVFILKCVSNKLLIRKEESAGEMFLFDRKI